MSRRPIEVTERSFFPEPAVMAAGMSPVQGPRQCHNMGTGRMQEGRHVSAGDQWHHPHTGKHAASFQMLVKTP